MFLLFALAHRLSHQYSGTTQPGLLTSPVPTATYFTGILGTTCMFPTTSISKLQLLPVSLKQMEDVTVWVMCKQGGDPFKVTIKRGCDVDDLKRKIKGEYFWYPGHHSLIKVTPRWLATST
jgi:hypothetical protein